MLEGLEKAESRVVGMKQTLRAIQKGSAKKVFLAKDVDNYLSNRIRSESQAYGIDVVMADSMKELGKACGVAVGAATAAILK